MAQRGAGCSTVKPPGLVAGVEAAAMGSIGLVAAGNGIALSMSTRARHAGVFDVLGPDRYLILVGVGLLAGAAYHGICHARRRSGASGSPATPQAPRQVLLVLALLVGYVVGILVCGYEAGTALFFLAALRLYGVAPVRRLVVLSAVLALCFVGLFTRMAAMPFPRGVLFD